MVVDMFLYLNLILHDLPSFIVDRDILPLFTRWCAFTYYTESHSWYFDFTKPYSNVYRIVNLILQGICVVFIVITDTLIIWKIYYLRRSGKQAIVLTPQHAFAKRRGNSREVRLVKNFLLLSICFLLMTICFNLHLGFGFWMDLATKSTSLLNLAKWAIYGLGNPVIRSKVLHPFEIRKTITKPTSTPTRIKPDFT
ncbi:unnamed protein product [Cylicocyclus nassatus]|uniref:7TM GPCR serpentine receptor class x (Srx) domain-containing protein n=1 Tax=Cylicocyclus nassatus TaxID=53992 RepID=A0AA36DMF9_CYLNA|nr:unnamed protein product [Cylicocyclus nassatus]